MARRGRRPSLEKQAARYQARVEMTHASVRHWLGHGDLTAALRTVLGLAERQALESDSAEAVYSLQFRTSRWNPCEVSLTLEEHRKMREAFRKAVNDALGMVGLFLEERDDGGREPTV